MKEEEAEAGEPCHNFFIPSIKTERGKKTSVAIQVTWDHLLKKAESEPRLMLFYLKINLGK